jgi:hypothetical protein
MKLFVWLDDAPPIKLLDNGDIQFYDYPDLWNFGVGDQIQYRTAIGTSVYFVVAVADADRPSMSGRLRLVTARGY